MKYFFSVVFFAAALACASPVFAAEPVKELKILTIGNSFSWSLRTFFAKAAAADGVNMVMIDGHAQYFMQQELINGANGKKNYYFLRKK